MHKRHAAAAAAAAAAAVPMSMAIAADGDEELMEHSTLEELICTPSYKWIFVGGKGGVGKTTTSCSIAVELAKRRGSVLILSTDPAHNLSDAFTQKFTNTPTLIDGFDNLHAMEIDSSYQENAEFRLKTDEGWNRVLPELLSAFPGIDEALSFAELMQSVQSMKYDVIVFDTAPTGHTLRLLSFPDLLEKALQKIQAIKNKMQGALQMLNMVAGQSFNEEDMHNRLDGLKAITTSVRETLQDPTQTTFVCVCIPEFLSVYETERLVQELAKQGIDCSNIIVNQVLFPVDVPDDLAAAEADDESKDEPHPMGADVDPSETIAALRRENRTLRKKVCALEANLHCRRKMQSKYLCQIQDLYTEDFNVVCMPLASEEVRGLDRLRAFSQGLLTRRDLPIVQDDKE
mmetsp:Transcript_19645/g.56316  ORF Transcript_19645/g.56316 Transcript_19645/m.56316 type:complete len:402 (+) Transcript_19645:826-2031(+)